MNANLLKARLERLPIVTEAFVNLLFARTAVQFLPFARLAKQLRAPAESKLREMPFPDIRRVCRAVETAATRPVLWAVCLPQAIAGHWMLRRRGVASIVCFGVRSDRGKLGAHAWLRVEDSVVLGKQSMAGFTRIAEFPQNGDHR